VVWIVTAGGAASAQPGADEVAEPAAGEESAAPPLTGFPGLLDTYQVERGRVVTDLPLLSIDVGLTSRLSVGTYLWGLLPFAEGGQGGIGKLRLRVYEGRRVVSAVDAIGRFVNVDLDVLDRADTVEQRSRELWLASNTSFRWTGRDALTFTAGTWSKMETLQLRQSTGDRARLRKASLIFAAGYERALESGLVVRAHLIAEPLSIGDATGPRFRAVSLGHFGDTPRERLLARLLVSARVGRTWLISGGGFARVAEAVPWFDVAKKW
jgi:hypothetical protein